MTLERYAAIKDEAIKSSLSITSPRLADKTADDAFLIAGNTQDQPGPVPVGEAIAYLLDVDKWTDVQADPGSANLMARLTLGTDGQSFTKVDMEATAVIRDVNSSDLTADQKRDFLALGDNRRTGFEVAGIGGVKQRDLGRMRIESDKGLI